MTHWTLSRQLVREVDRAAIEEFGIPGIVLMENAGRGTAELLAGQGISGPVALCCGKGNNGGDGFVIARHLETRGYNVRVLLFADPQQLAGDAATNFHILRRAGTPLRVFADNVGPADLDSELRESEWVVDALLGTGMSGAVREPFATIIDRINLATAKVLAVDLPSGLDCDTGEPLGKCVHAAVTATFVARKKGFENPAAGEWTGTIHVIDIGVPRALLKRFGAPQPSP